MTRELFDLTFLWWFDQGEAGKNWDPTDPSNFQNLRDIRR